MFTTIHWLQFSGRVAGLLGLLLAGSAAAQQAPPPPKAERTGQIVIAGFGPGFQSRSFLGVGVQEIDAERAREKKLSEVRGVEITSVTPDSAADKAGLKQGDVVLEYNGQRVEGCTQFQRLVSETPVGRQATLKIARDGAEQTITVTMGSRKDMAKMWSRRGEHIIDLPEIVIPPVRIPDIPHVFTTWRTARLGIVGESLEGQLADYFGVKEGVLVRSVIEDSPAAKAGIRAGDVIVEVGGTKVTSPREISGAIRDSKSETLAVTVVRDKQRLSLNVTIEREPGSGGVRPWVVRERGVRL